MSFRITFSPEAEESYYSITTQLKERWGDYFVYKLESKVRKCIDNLTVSAYIYPTINDNTEVRKCVLHKNVSFFYRVYGDVVLIIYFWDNRQDPIFNL